MGRKKRTVALVLGSGGARGLAHIGIIEELLNRGYEITSVSGTSMGALVGGIYAAGKLEDFKHWIEGVDKFKMFQLLDFTFRFDGLVKGSRIINTLKELVPDVPIEDLPIPFSAIATDVHAEKEIVFDSGCLFATLFLSSRPQKRYGSYGRRNSQPPSHKPSTTFSRRQSNCCRCERAGFGRNCFLSTSRTVCNRRHLYL